MSQQLDVNVMPPPMDFISLCKSTPKKKKAVKPYSLGVNKFRPIAKSKTIDIPPPIQYNEALVKATMNNFQMDFNTQGSYHGYTMIYMKKNFIYGLNASNPVTCYVSVNGSLAVFDMPNKDIQLLNGIFFKMLRQLNAYDMPLYYIEDMAQFFKQDKATRVFDNDKKMITGLPTTSFHGKVALKLMGLSHCKQTGIVKPLMHVHQVKIDKIDDEILYDANDQCLFV